jgi:glycine cleavage system H protein
MPGRRIGVSSRPGWGPGASPETTEKTEMSMAYPTGYKYTKDHEWIEITGDRGKVGITDYAQQQLGDVVFMELPEVGAKLKLGQSFGTIESVKAVSELYAPLSGEVVEVNTALRQKPETVNTDPHGSWMIVVRVADTAETGGLLDAAQYEALTK